MLGRIQRNVDKTTTILSIALTAIYSIFYIWRGVSSDSKIVGDVVLFFITAGAFVSSAQLLIIFAFIDNGWLGNVSQYRFHISVGCIVAIIASGWQLFLSFNDALIP